MIINVLQGREGATQATGLTVVIDVFRAFSTLCYIVQAGAKKIIIAGHKETVYNLKEQNPDYLVVGERGGHMLPGAEFGNSPLQFKDVDLVDKTIIFSSSAGTKGIINARNADEIITGAFVNVTAVIKYIRLQNPDVVSLICTGSADEHVADEDAVCARYIQKVLLGGSNDFEGLKKNLKAQGFADHFFDSERESHPEEDFELCMTLDRFDFVLKVQSSGDDVAYMEKIDI